MDPRNQPLPAYQPIRLGDGTPLELPLEWEEARPKLRAISFDQFILSSDPRLTRWYNAARYDREPPADWPGTWREAPQASAQTTQESITVPAIETRAPSLSGSDTPASQAVLSSDRAPPARPAEKTFALAPPENAVAAPNSQSDSAATTTGAIRGGLDGLQVGLDAVGAIEPTPLADGSNAIISLVRAATEPDRRSEHLTHAAISTVSMIPYLGDLAKGAKYGGKLAKETKVAAASEKAAEKGASRFSESVSTVARSTFSGILSSLVSPSAPGSPNPSASSGGAASPSAAPASATGSTSAAGSSGGGPGGAGGGGGSGPPSGSGSPGSQGFPGGAGGQPQQVDSILKRLWEGLRWVFDQLFPLGSYITQATFAFVSFNTALYAANRTQLKLNENLRLYSGEIQAAYMRLEAGRVMRDVARARSLEGNLSGLSDAQNRLERAQEEFTRPLQQVVLNLQTKLTDGVAAILELIDSVEGITEWLEEFFRKEVEHESSRNLIDAMERRRQSQREQIQQQMNDARRHFQGGQRPPFRS